MREPMTLEQDEERRFWEETNAAYAAMRADPQAWADEEELRAGLDGTVADGLESETQGEDTIENSSR